MKTCENKQKDERIYLVIEYIEKTTDRHRFIVVREPSQEVLDQNTMSYQRKEQLAALYYYWCSVQAEGPLISLRDMYSVAIDTKLGNYLTHLLNEKMLLNNLKDTSFQNAYVTKEYCMIKKDSIKDINGIRLMGDRTEQDKRHDYCDRVPLVGICCQNVPATYKKTRQVKQ